MCLCLAMASNVPLGGVWSMEGSKIKRYAVKGRWHRCRLHCHVPSVTVHTHPSQIKLLDQRLVHMVETIRFWEVLFHCKAPKHTAQRCNASSFTICFPGSRIGGERSYPGPTHCVRDVGPLGSLTFTLEKKIPKKQRAFARVGAGERHRQ